MTRIRRCPQLPRAERGVALVVVLMFLLIITSLAIFSARYATMGESMSRNQLDAEKARQAAESALRDAERDLVAREATAGTACTRAAFPPAAVDPLFRANCPQGLCDRNEDNAALSNWVTGARPEAWWPDARGGAWNSGATGRNQKPGGGAPTCSFNGSVPMGTFTGAPPIVGVARQPEYLVERYFRQNNRLVFFRITAVGFGSSETTQVVLQSYYQPFEAQ